METRKSKLKKLAVDLTILLVVLDFHAQKNDEEKRDYIDAILDEINFIQREIKVLRRSIEDDA